MQPGKLVLCYTANVQDVASSYTDSVTIDSSGVIIGPAEATVVVGSTTLNLNKTWVNAVIGDTANLSLNGINDDLNNISTANTTNETDINVASIIAELGETVTLSEVLGSNIESYTTGLSCTNSSNSPVYIAAATSGSLLIDATDIGEEVTCTFENTKHNPSIRITETLAEDTEKVLPASDYF